MSNRSVSFGKSLLAAALALSGAAASAQGTAPRVMPPFLRNVHRIVCLGDSITQVGDGPTGYVGLLRRDLQSLYPEQNFEVINAGISGNRTIEMFNRYQHDVLDRKPDLVTISVGVNDVWHGFYDNHPLGDGPRGVPLAAYKTRVENMVNRALDAGSKVVIMSTTVIYEDLSNRENAKAERYNAALRDIARRRHLVFVDYQRPFRAIIRAYRSSTGEKDNFLTVDGVHMNAAGNKLMAEVLLTALGVSPEDQLAVPKG